MTTASTLAPLAPQAKAWFLVLAIGWIGCTPYATSQIGPAVPSRTADCEISILEPGNAPSRPYRDVGVVTLEHCQDYRIAPCREWLREAACRLGGQVAYVDDYKRPGDPNDNVPNVITFRVLVAAYIADLYERTGEDPTRSANRCDPPCPSGRRCLAGRCIADDENCDKKTTDSPGGDEKESAQKCLE